MNPADFPIGSPQSRAAARSAIETRQRTEPEGILIQLRLVGRAPADPNRKCTCKSPAAGTVTLCRCFV